MKDFLKMRSKMFLSLLTGICLLTFTAVVAQDQNPASQSPAQENPPVEVQEDFSEEQLKTFVKANEEVMKVQMEGEKEMMKAIESENLEVDKFNQILMSRQNPDQETDASPEELEAFNKAAQKVMDLQKDLESEAQKAIESVGLDIEEYQQMMLAYQHSPTVQQRVEELMNAQDNPKEE